jgi:energy-coupling factor transport system ATP-binding protein
VVDLWHTYKNGFTALRGINLRVDEGEFTAIIGQNGSGKTTLVKHLIGLLKPTRGKIHVYGDDVAGLHTWELARFVGFVFQNPDHQLFCVTVKQEIEYGQRNLGFEEEEIAKGLEEAMHAVGLGKELLDKQPLSLSLALKQKVNIAAVLAMKPKILIVDEPTTGQDFRTRVEIMDLLRALNNQGKTVIIITHDMRLVAEYSERCIALKQGQVLCDGPTRKVFSDAETLAKTYLEPPQITRFAALLGSHDSRQQAVLSVNEAYEFVTRLLSD